VGTEGGRDEHPNPSGIALHFLRGECAGGAGPVRRPAGDLDGAQFGNSVFAADVDADGDLDVLSASRDDDKIAWYENTDGVGGFGTQRVISTAADGTHSVFAADLDGDGDPDVLSASANDDNRIVISSCFLLGSEYANYGKSPQEWDSVTC
jgi:hypothetical protein